MKILENAPGEHRLMSGNEAIARGAIEAGVRFSTSYPGSPVVQIPELLAEAAGAAGIHAEWSTNEIVALEAAEGASLAGLRSICVMKHHGLNVALDFLLTMNLGGTKAGLVLVVGDDPSAHSSISEQDTRPLAQMASERIRQVVILRTVTRLAHAQGIVTLGEIQATGAEAKLPEHLLPVAPPAVGHGSVYEKLQQAAEALEASPFNSWEGPAGAPWVIITGGPASKYCQEAIEKLGLEHDTGILKLGTQWPLPEPLIIEHLKHAKAVLFAEELDPYLERNVMALAAEHATDGVGPIRFFGKKSGHVAGPAGPGVLELNPDIVTQALAKARGMEPDSGPAGFRAAASELAGKLAPPRPQTFCAGCPHRASFFAMRSALKALGKGGYVAADIGCYTMGVLPTGFSVAKCVFCMGSGIGVANGFGNLERFGVTEPVVAVIGDSTFFHAGIPALISAKYNQAKFTLVVLDNSATAMTGFQPHPGIGTDAMGRDAPAVDIAAVCRGIGVRVVEADPYDIRAATEALYDLFETGGLNVLVLRRICNLLEVRRHPDQVRPPRVDPDRCVGDECGCRLFCVREFGCPGIVLDAGTGKARIDEVVCTGCNVCAALCVHGAIVTAETNEVRA